MRELTLTYTTTEITSNANNRNNNNVVVNFDLGDDYFSNFQINLSPTLTLAASTGISLNTGNNGQPVANNTNITLTKIWETATLSGGVQHGLTSSYGVAWNFEYNHSEWSIQLPIDGKIIDDIWGEFFLLRYGRWEFPNLSGLHWGAIPVHSMARL